VLNRKASELDLCDLTPMVSLPACHPAFPWLWGPARASLGMLWGQCLPRAARRLGHLCLHVGRQCGGGWEHGIVSWQMKLGLEGAVATELAGPPICLAVAQRVGGEEVEGPALLSPCPTLCLREKEVVQRWI